MTRTGWPDNRQRVRASHSCAAGRSQLAALGFHVQPSQANFVWCTHPRQPAKTVFDALKAERILVRYMSYEGWPDGLRISVGTDEQIDACLACLSRILSA